MLPPDAAAYDCIWLSTHAVAAPIPRKGSVWLDEVCLVPKLTSFCTVAWSRVGSISANICFNSVSGCCCWNLELCGVPICLFCSPAAMSDVARQIATGSMDLFISPPVFESSGLNDTAVFRAPQPLWGAGPREFGHSPEMPIIVQAVGLHAGAAAGGYGQSRRPRF